MKTPQVICSTGLCSRRAASSRAPERGVALVITLLLLSLLTALSVAMVISLSSETLIGGYYRNFRGAFYAADSGLNVARTKAINQLVAGVPTAWAWPPTAASCTSNTNVTISSDYGNATSLNSGNAAQSWNEQFKITTATPVGAAVQTSNVQAQSYKCTYPYTITSVGMAQGGEQQTITETGNVIVNVLGPATTKNVAFAYFGGFVDVYGHGIGPLVPGTMTGPMFTNNAWEFMASIPPWTAPYIFTDPIGQKEAQVDYWDSGWGQHWSSATSYGSGKNLVAPTFQQGLQLSQNPVPLPSNSFTQVEAVVDGNGTLWTPPSTPPPLTAAQLNSMLVGQGLTTPGGTAYATTTTTGVFLNKSTSASCGTVPAPCIAGGGFYVEGGADVQLIPSGSTAQQYVIKQGSTTTTITVDPAANSGVGTTVITQGSTTYPTINGVPTNWMNPSSPQAQTMLYVDGTVQIHGPGMGQGAVQDNAMINVTANGDIVATGDVLYKTEPVTVPQDTLVPATSTNPMNQVLGLYTNNGNFVTSSNQPGQNIQVDGSIATISPTESANCGGIGKGGQTSTVHINTFNNVGGMIQSCIFAADVNTENTWFDRRFTARAGFAPPWFPSTTIQIGGPQTSNPSAAPPQRLTWLSCSSAYTGTAGCP
jgi:Tfp pilus assembly protein PilX